MTLGATQVVRGCGVRQQGGAYAETGLSDRGLPLEAFYCDPPIRVDAEEIGLAAIGVKLLERADGSGVDVWDVIGSQHYPNVADFLEEVKRFGMSRRLPSTLDFSRLGPSSRHVVLHARGVVANWRDLVEHRREGCPRVAGNHSLVLRGATPETADRYCPIPPTHDLAFPEHQTMCCGLWWDDVAGGVPTLSGQAGIDVERTMPAFRYRARRVAPDLARDYRLAIVATLPITRIAVIRADDGRHERVVVAAEQSSLPVSLEDA
jgi:hypothetical protein